MLVSKRSKFKRCGEVDATITGKLLYLILDELAGKNGDVIIPQRKISDALHIIQRHGLLDIGITLVLRTYTHP